MIKPRSFAMKPRSFATKPRSVATTPRSFVMKPRGFATKPRSINSSQSWHIGKTQCINTTLRGGKPAFLTVRYYLDFSFRVLKNNQHGQEVDKQDHAWGIAFCHGKRP